MIVPLRVSHLDELVELHLRSFPEDFVTDLGWGFLRRVFYPWFLAHPAGFGFVWEEKGRLLGYVVGSLHVRSFYAAMLRRWLVWISLYSLGALIRHPVLLGRFVEVARAIRKSEELPYPADLAYIAVRPEAQGRGIGRRLVESLLDHLRHAGAEGCFVKTRKDLEASNRLYLATGYSLWKEFELNGERHCIYVIRLR